MVGDGLGGGVGAVFHVNDALDSDCVRGAFRLVPSLLNNDGLKKLIHHPGLDFRDADDVVVAIARGQRRAS